MDRTLLVAFLMEAIGAASPDPPGNEEAIAKVVGAWLDRFGIAYETERIEEGRYNILAKMAGSGKRNGDRGDLIFSAHMDTLPAVKDGWDGDPFCARIVGDTVVGRGACDMKSGLVAMVGAMTKLQASGLKTKGDLLLALTCGETSTCIGARRFVERGVLRHGTALLVSEPTSLSPVVAEKGALWMKASIRGSSGHVSGGGGGHVISDMIAWLQTWLQKMENVSEHVTPHPLLGFASLLPGQIRGGEAVNVYPSDCEVLLDYRFLPGEDPLQIVEQFRADNRIEIDVIDIKPAVETSTSDEFVLMARDVLKNHVGKNESVRGVSYFSDGAIYVPAYQMPMVIIGPGELGGSGAVNEWCAIDKLEKAQDIFFDIAKNYLL